MGSEKYTLVDGGILVNARLASHRNEQYPLLLDATAVRRADGQGEREAKAQQILELLDESGIGGSYASNVQPADLEVNIGYSRRGYGVFGMSAEMKRPALRDDVASRIATQAMRQMAHDLGTYPDSQISQLVYADISTKNGMTFETNPIGSSSMDTDGSEYDPTSDRVSLYAHNLYTHEMQLICISGMIALVKAG